MQKAAALKTVFLFLLAVGFVLAGLNHFRDPGFYLAMMPPFLPWHRELVFWSGVFEIIGGVLVLFPPLRRLTGWGLIALLIAVFPANIYAAVAHVQPPGEHIAPILLWLRLPFQGLFIAWVYWVAVRR